LSYVNWNFKETALFLGKPGKGAFQVETVADRHTPGWRSQLMFHDDLPYLYHSQSHKEHLRLSEKGAEGWQSTILKRRVANFVAEQAPGGDDVIAFQDISTSRERSTLSYIRRRGQTWHEYTVDDTPGVGQYVDMAIDSKGRMLITYYDTQTRGLKIYEENLGK
jgi:hypothetical protein